MKRRCVITGIGALTPCGLGHKILWDNVSAGRSAAKVLSNIWSGSTPVKIGAEVIDFNPSIFISQKLARRLDRSAQFALVASDLAISDSGLNISSAIPERCGVFDGSSMSALGVILDQYCKYLLGDQSRRGPRMLICGMCGNSSASLSLKYGFKGPAITLSQGSVSSSSAIGWGLKAIQNGELDFVLAGGTEAPIHKDLMVLFANSGVLSRKNDDPAGACRPFAKDRDGFVLGEGAVYLALEELEHAINRNANIYCELVGFAENTDAYHATAPDPKAAMLSLAIKQALNNGKIKPGDIGYINLHGTATRFNDLSESRAISNIFGAIDTQPLCGSTKPVTGHLLGACGAVEAAIVSISIKNQEVPLTLNCYPRDPFCEINCFNGTARHASFSAALSINSSFGGRNCCLVFKRYQTDSLI
jgi:3-oxoacyl-[acyl-carrier-protein] synthase II